MKPLKRLGLRMYESLARVGDLILAPEIEIDQSGLSAPGYGWIIAGARTPGERIIYSMAFERTQNEGRAREEASRAYRERFLEERRVERHRRLWGASESN